MTVARRRALAAGLALGMAACAGPAHAAEFPDRTITLVVPFSPGGNVDATARVVAEALAPVLGQPVIVLNKPGAGGSTGAAYAAKADPNGYTLLFTVTDTLTVVPRMMKTTYKLDAFKAIGTVATTTPLLVVKSGSRFKTLQDFVAEAKARPGTISIAHAGPGSSSQLALLQFAQAAGIRLNLVPYQGSGPALVDLLGGQIESAVDQMTSSLPHLKAGNMQALAVMSDARNPLVPEVPTLHEAGIGFDFVTTLGVYAPAATPAAVVATLSAALTRALSEEGVKGRLQGMGSLLLLSSTDGFEKLLQAEDARAQALADAGMLSEK